MSAAFFKERQDEELQVLQSIFESDVVDLRKKAAWNVFQPLEVKLTLKPQQSMGDEGNVYVQLDMVIKCPPRYPDVVPEIALTNPKGLSNQLVAELKADLERQAHDSVGEVMIWQLATSVQAFLHEHNKPPAQSFYEQMIYNKKQQQERTKELERQKEEQKRQQIEQDLLKQQEALRNEKRRRNEDLKTVESSTPMLHYGTGIKMVQLHPSLSPINPPMSQRGARSLSPATPVTAGSTLQSRPQRQRTTSTPMRAEDDDSRASPFKDQAEVTTVTFISNKVERIIQRGKCLGHSSSGSTIYAGMDQATGDLVAVAEWVLQWRNVGKRQNSLDREDDREGEDYLKQVQSIEQEMTALLRLNHPNLIRYLAWRHHYQPGRISVYVLMEYSGGTNLSVYTQHKDPLPLEMLRIYTGEVLHALCYLHRNSIVHKNLRASSVFIDCYGKVRLGDYSIDKRLGDLYQTLDKDRPRVHFSETGPMVLGRGGQRGDIYQLGLMLLTLIQGQPLKESIPYIPPHLPTVLQDFLHKTLLRDERLRWTASQLLEHSFIKSPLVVTPTSGPSHLENEHAEANGKEQNNDDISDNKEEEEFEYLSSLVASGQSRLASEFELLKVLGKGGFGDVLKVKNKLDGRFYAIKRIPLNPKSKMFNKKMKREVKLLSRLNHENVVRYYCSWIEISDDPAQSETSSSFTSSSQAQEPASVNKRAPHIVRSIPLTKTPVIPAAVKSANSSFDPVGDIENLVPRATDESVEWATSFDKGAETFQDSSSSEEEDEADVFGSSFMPKMDRSDDSVVFDTNGDTGNNTVSSCSEMAPAVLVNTQSQEAELEPEERMVKILYIQMEYCEKSTLRNCIDAGLWCDTDRVWRLFREIVEGLVHIHGQGMIHRDLKPVNIFLDSHDNVKIGDFGLATTDILAKKGAFLDVTLPSAQDVGLSLSRSGYSSGDGNLTGKVGTALYVSPEVMEGMGKVHYDQKVDIYSLGIIFFEMCYKALTTGMERVKVLSNLRLPDIVFPEDFDSVELFNQGQIIRWLLNHDPAQRPTSKELLSSDLLPPPIMQETELSEILRSTICNPQSTSYRYMLNAIFNQNMPLAQELIYDSDIYEILNPGKTALVYQKVKNIVSKVFTNHGAVQVTLPLFLPKCSIYDNSEQLVRFMDQRGGIVSVPFDLRVPFARYAARCNIQSMKRYAIEKVYRDKRYYNVLYSVHPKELTECAFDIITPSSSLIPDAEVLSIVQEIIDRFPALQAKNYYVRINHMSVLKAVLLHCGIAEVYHAKALLLLSDNDMNKSKRAAVLETELKLKITDQLASLLNFLLDTEGQLSKVTSILRCITKTTGPAGSLAKSGLHDIENILSYATTLGLRLQVLVSVGFIYNPSQYSGLMFQVMCDIHKKKKVVADVIAAGGRYDKLIETLSFPQLVTRNLPHGVGVSIAFEKLAGLVADDELVQALSPCDVIICAIGHQMLVKERLAIARDLWAAGFRTDVLFDKTENFDALQDSCRFKGISHIVILKDSETSAVRVRSLEKEKVTEKSVYVHALVEYLQKKATDRVDLSEPSNTPSQRPSGKENQNHGDCVHTVTTSNINSGNGPMYKYSIVFVPQEGRKFPQVARRRHEALIAGKASALYPWLPEKNLEVLALEMPISGIKTIQSHLEMSDPEAFESSIAGIMEKQAKFRKYLVGVMDMIHDLRFNKKCSFILLYSTQEETLRLLT